VLETRARCWRTADGGGWQDKDNRLALMARKRKVGEEEGADMTAVEKKDEGEKRESMIAGGSGLQNRTSCEQIESRGNCRLCGEPVTTADMRYKEGAGRYVHAACKRAEMRPVAKKAAVQGCPASGASAVAGHTIMAAPVAASRAAAACSEKRVKLCVYDKPPQGHLDLHEFEQFALDRLRVLNTISSCKAQGTSPAGVEAAIDKVCAQYMPLRESAPELEEDMRKDQVSHFILRMAFSRSAELRRWFLRQEEVLFKHRFNALDSDGRTRAMRMLSSVHGHGSSAAMSPISEEEFCQIQGNLMLVFGESIINGSPLREALHPWLHIYKVAFEQVPDLVARRRVYLTTGVAHIISPDLVSVAASTFRALLLDSLQEHARAFATKLEEETDRLGPLLERLVAQRVCHAITAATDTSTLTLQDLPAALLQFAPLCMRSTYQTLVEKQHLKHDARRQLTLFLKGVGVSMDDCLAFWRGQLKLKGNEFDKRYAYNIRHNYGAEGRRFNYLPFSCDDLIHSRHGLNAPLADCAHGCPFKEFDEPRLTRALASMHLHPSLVQRVVQVAGQRQYQTACSQVFLALHPSAGPSYSGGGGRGSALGEGLVDPNQYWHASRSSFLAPHSAPSLPDPRHHHSHASMVHEAEDEDNEDEDEDDEE
jgi:DNA primase large subunit